jgi:hypothetical protein
MKKFVLKELIRELKMLMTCLKLNIINMRAGHLWDVTQRGLMVSY